MKNMKCDVMKKICAVVALGLLLDGAVGVTQAKGQTNPQNEKGMEKLELTAEWDKVFPQSNRVEHRKVTFRNRYGITLAADLYKPAGATGRLAAIAVCGPFGAVKEQSSGLYAQTLAEQGFLTIAFDPSFTGESGGEPRYVASPDINTEDFCAAVDYLATSDEVDPERIGILGICGWGGMALNAAAIDTRIKATVSSTMYDMSRVTARGYFDSLDADGRQALRCALFRCHARARRIDYVRAAVCGAQVAPGAGVGIDLIRRRGEDQGGATGDLLASVASHACVAVDVDGDRGARAQQARAGRGEDDRVDARGRERVGDHRSGGDGVERVDDGDVRGAELLGARGQRFDARPAEMRLA